MTMMVGCSPGTVYSGTELVQGKCPVPGSRGTSDGGKRQHVLCLVAASQNLTNGTVVTMDGTFTVTVAAVGGAPAARSGQVAVAICSITASASTYIWCQVHGICSVRATADTVPAVQLTMGATAGVLDDAVTSASGVLDGITLTTTATGGFATAMLNYPQWSGSRHILT